MLCIILNNMPKKKDKKKIEGDAKGYFYKNKTTTLKSFDEFIKVLSEVDKDNVSGNADKRIRQIVDSPEFQDDTLIAENSLLLPLKKYMNAVLNYSDEVKKQKKSLSMGEIEIVEMLSFLSLTCIVFVVLSDKSDTATN